MKMTENDLVNKRIGFVGFGNMAKALWGGFSTLGVIGLACDPNPTTTEGISFLSLNELIDQSEILFLCVKPQIFREMIFPVVSQPVVSIMAGVGLKELSQSFQTVIRLMPNTPMSVSEGMTAICYPPDLTSNSILEMLLLTCGRILHVEESWMDVVTAISGSGPAFLYRLADIARLWAMDHGVPDRVATELFAQTLVGAGKLLLQTPNPHLLIQQVTSPNGTTMAGLKVADGSDLDGVWRGILDATEQRSKELSL